MARIPNDQLISLKQDISLQRLAESAGVTLKRHGADLIGLCPFHDDELTTLSFGKIIHPRVWMPCQPNLDCRV